MHRNGLALRRMDDLVTTAEAATQIGVDIFKFHRLVAKHAIAPAFEAPGLRGAKFWLPSDVDRLQALIAEAAA